MDTILAQNIRRLRRRFGDKQSDFAERVGVNQSRVSAWEKGAEPTYASMIVIAGLAGVTVEHLASRPIPDEAEGSASIVPNESELAEMLAQAQGELPVGTQLGDWPRYVAAALHSRLEQYAADRARHSGETAAPSTLHAAAVPFRAPTRPAGPE